MNAQDQSSRHSRAASRNPRGESASKNSIQILREEFVPQDSQSRLIAYDWLTRKISRERKAFTQQLSEEQKQC